MINIIITLQQNIFCRSNDNVAITITEEFTQFEDYKQIDMHITYEQNIKVFYEISLFMK